MTDSPVNNGEGHWPSPCRLDHEFGVFITYADRERIEGVITKRLNEGWRRALAEYLIQHYQTVRLAGLAEGDAYFIASNPQGGTPSE